MVAVSLDGDLPFRGVINEDAVFGRCTFVSMIGHTYVGLRVGHTVRNEPKQRTMVLTCISLIES